VATQLALRSALSPALPQPTDIHFQTMPQTVAVNTCSSEVILQTISSGTLVPTGTGVAVGLSASGLGFFADSACAFPVTSVYVGAGTSTQSFYFRGTSATTATLTATATGFSAIQQTEAVE
jgi:hypothetical protein